MLKMLELQTLACFSSLKVTVGNLSDFAALRRIGWRADTQAASAEWFATMETAGSMWVIGVTDSQPNIYPPGIDRQDPSAITGLTERLHDRAVLA